MIYKKSGYTGKGLFENAVCNLPPGDRTHSEPRKAQSTVFLPITFSNVDNRNPILPFYAQFLL